MSRVNGLVLLLALAVVGCGKVEQLLGKKNGPSGTVSSSGELDGSWHRAGVTGGETLTYSGNRFSSAIDQTASGTGNVRVRALVEGSITYGGDSSSIPGAKELDVRPDRSQVLITANDASSASLLSTIHYCGLSDWTAGQERDVTGTSCDPGSHQIGVTSYTIYRIQNGQLQFGDREGNSEDDGTTSARRYSTLSSTVYVK